MCICPGAPTPVSCPSRVHSQHHPLPQPLISHLGCRTPANRTSPLPAALLCPRPCQRPLCSVPGGAVRSGCWGSRRGPHAPALLNPQPRKNPRSSGASPIRGLWSGVKDSERKRGLKLSPGHMRPGRGLPRRQRLERGLQMLLHPDLPRPHHSAQCHLLQGASPVATAMFPSSSASTARAAQLGPGCALQDPGLSPAEEGPLPEPRHSAPPSCRVTARHACPLDRGYARAGTGRHSVLRA